MVASFPSFSHSKCWCLRILFGPLFSIYTHSLHLSLSTLLHGMTPKLIHPDFIFPLNTSLIFSLLNFNWLFNKYFGLSCLKCKLPKTQLLISSYFNLPLSFPFIRKGQIHSSSCLGQNPWVILDYSLANNIWSAGKFVSSTLKIYQLFRRLPILLRIK